MSPPTNPVRAAIGWMVLATGLFGVMDTLVKWLTAGYPVMQLVFVRSGVSVVLFLVLLPWLGGWASLRTRRPFAHALRAVFGLASVTLFFLAFRDLPMADVYALSFVAPLFITALSVPILGEPVGWRRWAAVLAGFAGVTVMLRPDAGMPVGPALMALAAALFYALAMLSIRALARTETATATVVYLLAVMMAASGAVALPGWVPPSAADWGLMAAMGAAGTGAQFAITHAFRLAPAAVVAPFEYTGMLWAVGFGWAVFGDVPTADILTGAAVIIASGLYILHRESRRAAVSPSGGSAE